MAILRIGDVLLNEQYVVSVRRNATGSVLVDMLNLGQHETEAAGRSAAPGHFVFRDVEAEAVWKHFSASALNLAGDVHATSSIPSNAVPLESLA